MIDITDEKMNSIIYEMFDTPASLFFAKTPVHNAEHKGSHRIFADLILCGCRAVPRKPRKFSTAKISERTVVAPLQYRSQKIGIRFSILSLQVSEHLPGYGKSLRVSL